MTWTTQAYCTLADVKLALDPQLGNTDDTFLTGLITTAQSDLDSEIGYMFQQDGTSGSPATRLYDGDGTYSLWTEDIVSVATVIETATVTYLAGNGVWVAGTTTTVDITADIILKPNNYAALNQPANKMVRNSGSPFLQGVQNYKVTGVFGQPYIAGQTYPGVPNDLSRACVSLVIHYYKMRDTNYADILSGTGPGMGAGPGGADVRMRYVKGWPVDVRHVVNKYSHTRFLTRTY